MKLQDLAAVLAGADPDRLLDREDEDLAVADRAGPRVLEDRLDDHLALNNARIPTIDIIDFDYPRPRAATYWHTTKDIPDNCSALSLAKVGYVLEDWLKKAK